MKRPAIVLPDGLLEKEEGRVLLHACCAPCSSAIVEWMVKHEFAESLGLGWIDGDYDHDRWRQDVCGLEGEPERGRRCELCFTLRLTRTAQKAKELYFTTTLASSRWKSLEQIERAGRLAEQAVAGTTFWDQNWRKGGLQDRRNQLLKEYQFYNQQYCGCEYSMRTNDTNIMNRV